MPIRIINTERVPDTFHARYNAKSRTYLYRIAIPDIGTKPIELQTYSIAHTKFIPIEEVDRCYFIQ